MTWKEMDEKYLNQWLGLIDVKYEDDDGISVESGVIKYIGKNASELGMLMVEGEDIVPYYTTPNDVWQLGFTLGGIVK